jgi:hypothetical protein
LTIMKRAQKFNEMCLETAQLAMNAYVLKSGYVVEAKAEEQEQAAKLYEQMKEHFRQHPNPDLEVRLKASVGPTLVSRRVRDIQQERAAKKTAQPTPKTTLPSTKAVDLTGQEGKEEEVGLARPLQTPRPAPLPSPAAQITTVLAEMEKMKNALAAMERENKALKEAQKRTLAPDNNAPAAKRTKKAPKKATVMETPEATITQTTTAEERGEEPNTPELIQQLEANMQDTSLDREPIDVEKDNIEE